MDWIDERLAVGGWSDAHSDLRDVIDVVVDVRPLFTDYGIKADAVIDTAFSLMNMSRNQRILLRCFSGKDRAPFVAMVYIALRYAISYEEAYQLVKSKRPQTVFHWDWVDALKQAE